MNRNEMNYSNRFRSANSGLASPEGQTDRQTDPATDRGTDGQIGSLFSKQTDTHQSSGVPAGARQTNEHIHGAQFNQFDFTGHHRRRRHCRRPQTSALK